MRPSVPFVWSALGLALTAGFGLGAALLVAPHLGMPAGAWWAAAAQAHGHVQVFGWAGLMILGVGVHFLPRLRGAQLVGSSLLPWSCALLTAGLALRAAAQPLTAAGGWAGRAWAAALVLSGGLELAGASLSLAVLTATGRQGPPLRSRTALLPVLPLFVAGFTAFWSALAVNAAALWRVVASADAGAAAGRPALLGPSVDDAVVQLGFLGFIVPVAAAMSERTFPLFYVVRTPAPRTLRRSVALVLVGLVLRLAGAAATQAPGAAADRLALGAGALAAGVGLVWLSLAVQVLRPRQQLPHRRVSVWTDPLQLLVMTAFAWLLLAGLLLILEGLGGLLPWAVSFRPSVSAFRHALGAGFVSLLIFAVGPYLLPGALGRRLGPLSWGWWLFALAFAAALLRTLPLRMPRLLPPAPAAWTMGAAGLADAAAVVLLAAFVSRPRS
ncbi:MAG: hypothetical protein IRY95_03690 [Clostridia bacterium]|nr:hypothetical protein [Clostridia bacterium]